jgi:anti-sigma regulatory factor (Ser/Thr protein kinase)
MSPRLLLDPEPQSVRRARRWVVDELQGLGRDDLVDAAELGVSELVTNAILHAHPPITVRLRGTRQHPRVEVHDNSSRPPSVNADMAEDDQLLRTVGRGMGIVALYSTSWGADVSPDGKVIWFEPADEPGAETQAEGSVFDLTEVVDELMADHPEPDELMRVRLLGMPVHLFAAFRNWYAEIRRELRILALSHPTDYPIARELTELTLEVERDRRLARGVERLDEAIRAGVDRVDLDYLVAPSAPATMAKGRAVLDEVDRFCREQKLLTMPAPAQLVELRTWYMGEFVRQGAGEQPIPWPGAYTVDPTGR